MQNDLSAPPQTYRRTGIRGRPHLIRVPWYRASQADGIRGRPVPACPVWTSTPATYRRAAAA